MYFITNGVLKIKQQHSSDQDIITLTITTIVNSYFNKHPMSWEIIHLCMIQPSGNFMKAMCHHQTLAVLTKHCPKKLNQSPCTICYMEKMTTFTKGTKVDTTNLKPGEILHIYLAF